MIHWKNYKNSMLKLKTKRINLKRSLRFAVNYSLLVLKYFLAFIIEKNKELYNENFLLQSDFEK
jgi:CRISPR/Cas system-associated protein Csx1